MKYENLFKIHIPEPCQEDWSKMTPNKQGSFCKACAKTVVDFSGKTDEDIQKFLLENTGQKICGRFRVNQLEDKNTEEIPRLKIEKPKFQFPGFLIPVLTPFRACAMSLMIFASAALMSCGNSNTGGGEDEHLAGTVAIVDSTHYDINHRIQGGVSIRNINNTNDSTCNIDDNNIKVGKIKVENTDTLKTDSTETIQGEVEPRIKMGLLMEIKPEENNSEEKEYLKGDIKTEKTEY